jgi:hypothetical protein
MKALLKLLVGIFTISIAMGQVPDKGQSFELFWVKFRDAALAEDYPSLNKLVKFPLEVKGVDDETPASFYSHGELAEIFPTLLDQIVYNYEQENVEENSLRELVRKKEVIKISPDKTHHRVDQFEFQKVNGQWMLTRAYLE